MDKRLPKQGGASSFLGIAVWGIVSRFFMDLKALNVNCEKVDI